MPESPVSNRERRAACVSRRRGRVPARIRNLDIPSRNNGWTYTCKVDGAVEVQTRVERNSADNGTHYRLWLVGWYASLQLLTTSRIRGHCSARLQLTAPSVGIPSMGLMPDLT